MAPTAERVREIVSYNPLTGQFIWLVAKSKWIGKVAGATDNGYISIGIDGKYYRGHRLAFLLMTGEWPSLWIDHIDGNKSNNRWANLREANNSLNRANSRRPSTNTSGFKGVDWFAHSKKWRAQIGVNGRKIHLGTFDTVEQAHAAYVSAATKYFGEFMRVA